MLALSDADLAAILRHAAAAYPEECCGLLLGEALPSPPPGAARVTEVVAAANRDPEPRRGYDVDARALLDGHRRARQEGRSVVGYYHSHPDATPVPSRRDREAALPGARYLIVEVRGGAPGAVRCWERDGDGAMAERELLVVAP